MSGLFDRQAKFLVGWKKLAAVEVDADRSNQREINGVGALRGMLGPERRTLEVVIARVDRTGINGPYREQATWYDARERNPDRNPEFRLYLAGDGRPSFLGSGENLPEDLLVVMLDDLGRLVILIGPEDGPLSSLLSFVRNRDEGVEDKVALRSSLFKMAVVDAASVPAIGQVLENLDLVGSVGAAGMVGALRSAVRDAFREELERPAWPRAERISRLAIQWTEDAGIHPARNPDDFLLSAHRTEQAVFQILERILTGSEHREMLADDPDLDRLLGFAMSVLNRRKSRAGKSVENILGELLSRAGIPAAAQFKHRGDVVDFAVDLPRGRRAIVEAKRTLKDRWKQIGGGEDVFLVTLDSDLTGQAVKDIRGRGIRLAVPAPLQVDLGLALDQAPMTIAELLAELRSMAGSA